MAGRSALQRGEAADHRAERGAAELGGSFEDVRGTQSMPWEVFIFFFAEGKLMKHDETCFVVAFLGVGLGFLEGV